MHIDPITEEIREIRRRLAAQCDNDLAKIFADLRQREASSGRTYVTLPARRIDRACAADDSRSERPVQSR